MTRQDRAAVPDEPGKVHPSIPGFFLRAGFAECLPSSLRGLFMSLWVFPSPSLSVSFHNNTRTVVPAFHLEQPGQRTESVL